MSILNCCRISYRSSHLSSVECSNFHIKMEIVLQKLRLCLIQMPILWFFFVVASIKLHLHLKRTIQSDCDQWLLTIQCWLLLSLPAASGIWHQKWILTSNDFICNLRSMRECYSTMKLIIFLLGTSFSRFRFILIINLMAYGAYVYLRLSDLIFFCILSCVFMRFFMIFFLTKVNICEGLCLLFFFWKFFIEKEWNLCS